MTDLWIGAVCLLVGVVAGYCLALHAACWGIRASTQARSDSKALFEPQHGSAEVRMAEEREHWLEGPAVKEDDDA